MLIGSPRPRTFLTSLIVSLLVSIIIGGTVGIVAGVVASHNEKLSSFVEDHVLYGRLVDDAQESTDTKIKTISEESDVISVVENATPAVVSIVIRKDVPVYEKIYTSPFGNDMFGNLFNLRIPVQRQNGTEKKVVGGGTGFLVSSDGYIVTNKHVVSDETAEYTVLLQDDTEYTATVLALDPNNDVAIVKIEGSSFPKLEMGDSAGLKVGQSVIAIGNALNEFRNTVSTGVISGLARSITANGAGVGTESLTGLIQTDASINFGNSGGPLLNIGGQVIGLNTAIAASAENIGFAIPMNDIKALINSVKENGRIVKPWLGIRFVQVTPELAKNNMLSVDYGALILRGEARTDLAVIPGGPADKAGLVENDILLEVNGQKLDADHPLHKVLATYKVGDRLTLKVLSKGSEKTVEVKLEEQKQTGVAS